MVSGMDRSGIAAKLHQSPNTVRTHIRSILSKLDVHSSLEAVTIARSAGLRPAERAGAGRRLRYIPPSRPPEWGEG